MFNLCVRVTPLNHVFNIMQLSLAPSSQAAIHLSIHLSPHVSIPPSSHHPSDHSPHLPNNYLCLAHSHADTHFRLGCDAWGSEISGNYSPSTNSSAATRPLLHSPALPPQWSTAAAPPPPDVRAASLDKEGKRGTG